MGPYLKLLLLTTYQAQHESTQSKTGPREKANGGKGKQQNLKK